jgi:hypothetical protein
MRDRKNKTKETGSDETWNEGNKTKLEGNKQISNETRNKKGTRYPDDVIITSQGQVGLM